MKYVNQMQDKHGFQDGTNIPPEAEHVRTAYVTWLNHQAKKLGSSVRAYAFDRIDRNWCLICLCTTTDMRDAQLTEEKLTDPTATQKLSDVPNVDPDTIMHAIISATDEDYDFPMRLVNSAYKMQITPTPEQLREFIADETDAFLENLRESYHIWETPDQ